MNVKRINREIKNPYLLSYLSFALICVLSFGLAVMLISTKVSRDEQAARDEAKLEMISENVHQQLSFMRKVEIEITGNTIYYPKYFTEYKYYEIEVLEHFEQYLSRLSMVDELLLYYGDNRLFRGTGSISDFDVYFQELSGIEKEEVRQWLDSSSWDGFSFLVAKNIYIGVPLKTINGFGNSTAKLCFEIKEDTFAEYLDMLGGISNGSFALYHDEACLYRNTDVNLNPYREEKNKIVLRDDIYDLTFVFMPDNSFAPGGKYAPLTVSLILAITLWIVMVAYLFAGRTYKPVRRFIDTYRTRLGYEDQGVSGNNLEEMGDAIENLLIQHQKVRTQLGAEEKKLKEVILRSLLKGDHMDTISRYMEYVQLDLSGKYFCVCSVVFEEKLLNAGFTNADREAFERKIRDYFNRGAIYVLSKTNPCDMSVICCLRCREDKVAVLDAISSVSEEYCGDPLIGSGNIYDSLTKLSASYLESMDALSRVREERNRKCETLSAAEFDSQSSMQFFVYLREGNEDLALEELRHIVSKFENENLSFLFQQYIFAEFMHNIAITAKACNVEISPQLRSLLVSAKSIADFAEAVELVVHQFCGELRTKAQELELGKSKEIIAYITEHFMEYDISMESVSKILNVKPDVVRNSIMQCYGKTYKEFVLFLRMEEAKRLLAEEGLSVEETSRRLGYANASYFIKLFKKAFGVTPAEYKLVKGPAK